MAGAGADGSMDMGEVDEEFDQRKREFMDFIDPDNTEHGSMASKIAAAMSEGKRRVPLDLDALRAFDPDLARNLMRAPHRFMPPLQAALNSAASHIGANSGKKTAEIPTMALSFTGSFGNNLVSPRGLTAGLMGQLVCVEGIVTKAGLVRSKLVQSVHYCDADGSWVTRSYQDATAPNSGEGMRTTIPPQTNKDGTHPVSIEHGLCTYKDHQKLTVQEMPERSPHGQLPRSIEVIADDDLADSCKPGDRVQIIGVFRPLGRAMGGAVSCIFQQFVYASSIGVIGQQVSKVQMTADDVSNARTLAARDDVLDVLSRSLAPSIYGHEYVKKALLLQLLGGAEKCLENGTHLRGDINILMVGDPSTAKSQLLRFVMGTAPLAVSTTGRGSSGVGLTAAVTSDGDTGERRLEAGAMVMADRGVVCIDEFDKMNELDRVAIHEVMEQQTVTIAKAGIHASLNARCSVLAAANPVYGQYAKDKRPQENIGLPDSLLSRFDLLFVVLDTLEPELDRRISDHVLRMHRYQRPGQEGVPIALQEGFAAAEGAGSTQDESEATPMWERFNPLLHGGAAAAGGSTGAASGSITRGEELLSLDFVKKFIHYAKTKFHNPTLTDEAREYISIKYAELRGRQDARTLPVTARSLETLIRLATAHAKLRLSREVQERDAIVAVEMVSFALYHDVEPRDAEVEAEAEAEVDADGDDRGEAEQDTGRRSTGRKRRRDGVDTDGDASGGDDELEAATQDADLSEGEGEGEDDGGTKRARQSQESMALSAPPVDVASSRFSNMKAVLNTMFKQQGDELNFVDLLETLNAEADEAADMYKGSELVGMLKELENQNHVMFHMPEGEGDGEKMIYRI